MELEREVGAFHRSARGELRGVGGFQLSEEILLAGGFFFLDRGVVEEGFGGEFERVAEVGEDDAVGERGVEDVREDSALIPLLIKSSKRNTEAWFQIVPDDKPLIEKSS